MKTNSKYQKNSMSPQPKPTVGKKSVNEQISSTQA